MSPRNTELSQAGQATVVPLRRSSLARLACTQCGAQTDAACNCGVGYMPAGAKATEAVAANPEKSDRAIAAEIGVASNTVRRARQATAPSGAVRKRVGKDGKARKLPTKAKTQIQKQRLKFNEHRRDDRKALDEARKAYILVAKTLTKVERATELHRLMYLLELKKDDLFFPAGVREASSGDDDGAPA